MHRYLENLSQHERFVSAVRDHTMLSRRNRVGPNIFHYISDVMEYNFLDIEDPFKFEDLYA